MHFVQSKKKLNRNPFGYSHPSIISVEVLCRIGRNYYCGRYYTKLIYNIDYYCPTLYRVSPTPLYIQPSSLTLTANTGLRIQVTFLQNNILQ